MMGNRIRYIAGENPGLHDLHDLIPAIAEWLPVTLAEVGERLGERLVGQRPIMRNPSLVTSRRSCGQPRDSSPTPTRPGRSAAHLRSPAEPGQCGTGRDFG